MLADWSQQILDIGISHSLEHFVQIKSQAWYCLASTCITTGILQMNGFPSEKVTLPIEFSYC